MLREPAIYIMANKRNGTIYVGVTNDLTRRVYEHKSDVKEGFTKKYRCHKLVYYEFFATMPDAISREKQLKSGSRKKKIALIEKNNFNWHDLYESIC